jgi:CDP-glycerol glycerophosphotransferase
LLSVIVPAYRVQAYLDECLDSILGQAFSDVEVIAVDDCSPDRTGELLDEVAARDPRVRVIHLAQNVGLGRARNAGLDAATGTYVWFVDSDDWITPGCLEKIAARLAATEPDVLVVDYARTYWNLRAVRNTAGHLLAGAPESFGVAEYPELLRLFPGAWTKIVRREFLLDLKLQFPEGYYEDLPFTYPVLCAARRISTLDEVCVCYRQRRHGSILTTRGSAHGVLLDQYRLVFQRIGATFARQHPTVMSVVFDQMCEHLLQMLGRAGRLGSGQAARVARREFFLGASCVCRAHRPANWDLPAGINGIRYRLLEGGSWSLFCVLRSLYQVFRAGRDILRAAKNRARSRLRKAAGTARTAMLRGYYRGHTLLPIDPNLAVYSIYWGGGYGCHAAAIYEKARELAPQVRGVWIVERSVAASLPPELPYAVTGTAAYYRTLARAKYVFNNVNFPDFMVKRPGTIHVQTHHGTPLKSMGIDLQQCPTLARANNFAKLLNRCDRWDFSISYSSYCTQVWERAYPAAFTALEYGAPRNDALVDADPRHILKLRADLGITPDETVVLYAPTFREYRRPGTPLVDHGELLNAIGAGARLLVRDHHFDRSGHVHESPGPGILDVSDYPRVADLYLAADVLITDYSSGMFDYAVLDRPIVIYAPDWEVYRSVRGTYFDLPTAPPGPVARTASELFNVFRSGAYRAPEATEARAAFRDRFCRLDDGHAAERVVQRIMLGIEPQPPRAAAAARPHARSASAR